MPRTLSRRDSPPPPGPDVVLDPTEPLVLASPPPASPRAPLPIAATIVPIAAAVVLWLVTGSTLTLLFAALGPLIAIASLLDGARGTRRARRAAAAEGVRGRARVAAAVDARHRAEREAAHVVTPDAGALLSCDDAVWRPAAVRGRALVVGRGVAPSAVRVVGGGDDPASTALRARATSVSGMPVTVDAGEGICVVGEHVAARAVARALVLQLCLALPPGRLRLVSTPQDEEWAAEVPHRDGDPQGLRVAYVARGEHGPQADAVIAVAAPGEPVPSRCGAVLALASDACAELIVGARRTEVTVEGVSLLQAAAVAAKLAERPHAGRGSAPPPPCGLGAVLEMAGADAEARAGAVLSGLAVPLGLGAGGTTLAVDLVSEGPHAVVAGVTGSGKSELLVSWVAALCARHAPQQVAFLLADFKGGTAFQRLAGLPHVTGVLTDLDGGGARRAVESLTAELRRREGVLAAAGARDIGEAGDALGRLVIVVDEFAALLAEHPDLHAVFTDVAARGRALGMHLVLGTQRLGGVVRDALLANCPLRVCLRVTDPTDSRAVIGSADAAALSGDPRGRGLAYVRGAADAEPKLLRVALTGDDDLADILATHADASAPHRPWLPALPARASLRGLRENVAPEDDALVVGVADEPARQRQPVVTLSLGEDRGFAVIGAASSGKSTLVDTLAAQVPSHRVLRLPAAPEAAWDALTGAAERPAPALMLVDDADALLTAFPPDYAAAFLTQLERTVRTAGARRTTVVLTLQRFAGPVARIAELLPQRLLLRMPSRVEHVAAGGEAERFDPTAPAGRGVLAGRTLQVAVAEESAGRGPGSEAVAWPAPATPQWRPAGRVAAVIARDPGVCARELAADLSECEVLRVDDLAPGTRVDELGGIRPVVVVGDADAWQRHWSLLARLRGECDLVVAASCAAEFRLLSGTGVLPPYIDDPIGRGWLVSPDGRVARVRFGPEATH